MTTDELIEKLRNNGVSEDSAEGFRDLHMEVDNVGSWFQIPVLTEEDNMLYVTAQFTGADKLFVPDWNEITSVTSMLVSRKCSIWARNYFA